MPAKQHCTDIFIDRRTQQLSPDQPCRRAYGNALDARPWWLKIGYVTQHFLAETKDAKGQLPPSAN